eukprot:6369301-Ditylum_brightwellii.AAC.1
MDLNFHAEIDGSDFLTGDDISKYHMMVGSLNWFVTHGCYGIHYTVCTLERHMMVPREGHMRAMHQVVGYLCQNYCFSIQYDITEPELKGKPVITSGFFGSSHATCLLTQRSTTCVLLFINSTPIRWYSRHQNWVETSTYGSEIVARHIAVNLIKKYGH